MRLVILVVSFLALAGSATAQIAEKSEYEIFVPKPYIQKWNSDWVKKGVQHKVDSVTLFQYVRHGVLSSVYSTFTESCENGKQKKLNLILTSVFDAPKEVEDEIRKLNAAQITKVDDAALVFVNSLDFRKTFLAEIATMLVRMCGDPEMELYVAATFWRARIDENISHIIYVTTPTDKNGFERFK